jgi:hypothetical protein
MPIGRGIRVLLLVEDEALERFVRRTLLALGFQVRDIRVKRSPKGRGSGETWVRRNYPDEVKAHRSKAGYQENIALVVGIDADKLKATERADGLDAALVDAGLEKRQPREKICLIIPKRYIETWLVFLKGSPVDEDLDEYKYHPSIKSVDYPAIADQFVERYRNWKHGNPAETTPPSMILAFEELKRLGL